MGIVGGDFNDGIWHASPRRRRIWHDWLDSGRLFDPQYQTVPQPQGPSHTRGGKRLDALLLSQTTWNALTPVAYQATTFPLSGGHAGVAIHTTVVLLEPQPPDPEVISIRDCTGTDPKRFRAHMWIWYRGFPQKMTMETASNMVLKEVARYVAANKKPERRPNQAHKDLQARLAKNPCDQAALKLWGEHMQCKCHTEVMKKLRRFCKSAIVSTGTIFAELPTWLPKPAHVSSMSPTPASALRARLKPNVVPAKLFQCSRLSARNKKSSKFVCPPTKPTRAWWQNMLFASLGGPRWYAYICCPARCHVKKTFFQKQFLLEHHWNTAGTSYLNVAGTSNLQ